MKFVLRWIDVTDNLRSGQRPIVVLERPFAGDRKVGDLTMANTGRVGEFWVPKGLLNQDEIEWTLTAQGEYVSVPVHGYDTELPANSCLIAVGMEYGMRAAASLARRINTPPMEVTIVVGSKVDRTEKGYRCYAGLAIRIN